VLNLSWGRVLLWVLPGVVLGVVLGVLVGVLPVVVPGMHVVQTPSPWAIVASRWTCRPRTWEMSSVSASHSCGNSCATWETGQCCWHSCSETPSTPTVSPTLSRGRDRFDQQYDDLAAQALRFLAETGGDDAVMAFARRRVADLETHYREVVDAEPALPPSEALARALTQGGYAASVRTAPVGDQLCQQHCPVSHVAHEFPQLCEAETELIGKLLGRHVQRLATIAHGDGVCTTSIPDKTMTTATTSRTTVISSHERLHP
jgi:hypothetical protein